jgi:hypothetical protein
MEDGEVMNPQRMTREESAKLLVSLGSVQRR